jgi:hypothetical protein
MDNNTPIYQYANPMGTHLRPPEHSEPITASGFEISLDFIEFVQKKTFMGEIEENPYSHLREFKRICDLIRIKGMSDETIQWKLFPFSLTGKAKHWYKLNVECAQGDWKTLCNEFLSKFFPISKVNDLRKEVLTFRQLEEESLAKSWDRFIDLTLIGPDLAIPDLILFQHFYEGLSKDSREFLDLSFGGPFLHLLTSEARVMLEKITSQGTRWTKIHFKPPKKKNDFSLEQKEEVLIAKSQPLQS